MSAAGNVNSLPGSGFRIIEGTGHRIILESTLDTIQAANNRLRMLRKHNPHKTYCVEEKAARVPKFTVSPIPKVTVTAIR